jgi:hypothetical protein
MTDLQNNTNIDDITFKLDPTAIYFNMARSFSSKYMIEQVGEYINGGGYSERGYKVFYGLISGACIYSYLAVESYVNNQLYLIKGEIDINKPHVDKLKLIDPKFKPSYEDNRFSYPDEKYINTEETKNKLKNICTYRGIPYHVEINNDLWMKFCQLLEDIRHFMIHPKPYNDIFNEKMKIIFEKNSLGVYIETAEEIIGYLYDQKKLKRPEYLIGNTLFVLDHINIIKGNDLLAKS